MTSFFSSDICLYQSYQQKKTLHLSEFAKPGTVLEQVEAINQDEGRFGQVVYSIEEVDREPNANRTSAIDTRSGLDMDAHNQQIIFPTVAVCPIESYKMNRTANLAYSMLGKTGEENINSLTSFLTYLPQLNFETMGIAFEQTANFSENQKYITAIDTNPLRTT